MKSKIPSTDIIAPRTIKDHLSVTGKTVKRWEIKYGWRVLKLNERFVRYVKSEVEDSLNVEFPSVEQA